MKPALALSLLFFLLPIALVRAADAFPSYVELTDEPTIAVDWTKSDTQAVTLHGNRVITFANGQKGGKYLLIVRQDDTGSHTVTWPSSLRWPGTSPPALTTTANKKDFLSIFCDGVNYYGLGLSQNF